MFAAMRCYYNSEEKIMAKRKSDVIRRKVKSKFDLSLSESGRSLFLSLLYFKEKESEEFLCNRRVLPDMRIGSGR